MPHFIFDHFKNTGFQAAESTQTPPTSQEWHAWHAFSVMVVRKGLKSGQLKANGLWVFYQTDSVTSPKPQIQRDVTIDSVCSEWLQSPPGEGCQPVLPWQTDELGQGD